MPYSARTCERCPKSFIPPRKGGLLSIGDNHLRLCPECRRIEKAAAEGEPPAIDTPVIHRVDAPIKQCVFDLETWGLDRGWGVTMIASFLIHGGHSPEKITLTLRDFPAWKAGRRSDDREMVGAIFDILSPCHIWYAHNGDRFDVRWLRTVALKYGIEMPRRKLIDPCAIAWKRYLLGRNSLEAVADFLGLEQKGLEKMHISPEVWRTALMNDDNQSWNDLVLRCESDVDLLNEVAAKVTGDVGLIDYGGSWK